MNNKRTRGNKEAKKPKQGPRVSPPPTGGINAPALPGKQKPYQLDKK